MNDYIKIEDVQNIIDRELRNHLTNYERIMVEYVINAKIKMGGISNVDVVEVVRCKDCEHWKCNPNTDEYGVCKKVSYDDFEVVMDADDFCSYGEPKEQEYD